MFTFLGWFFVVIIVLAVCTLIFCGIILVNGIIKALKSPAIQNHLRKMDSEFDRYEEIRRREDELDYLEEMDHLDALEKAYKNRHASPREQNYQASGRKDAYIRNPDGSRTKLKQVF